MKIPSKSLPKSPALIALLALTACIPDLSSSMVVNTAQGAVAGAVLANKDEATRQNLVQGAMGTVTGREPPAPKSETAKNLEAQEAELQTLLVGSGVSVSRTNDRIVLSIPERLGFRPDNFALNSSLNGELVAISSSLLKYPNSIVQVLGHYDNSGTEARRRYLSERRAKAIGAVLQQNGVAKLRIQTVGLADTAPAASNDTSSGREQNRRVDIYILPLAK